MKPILIIKVGETLPSLRAKKGDFEDWVRAGLQVDLSQTRVVDVRQGLALPPYHEIAGIVITGSHAMVTERQAWSERTAAWLPGAIERDIPILGICYGHQLLAHALGGSVTDNPQGHEFGTLTVHLDAAAARDPLLSPFSSPLRVHVSHYQTVRCLPEGARLLAHSEMDAHQAFVVDRCAWGVQFHPEFDAEIVRTYIDHFQDRLIAERQDPERLKHRCQDTPYGPQILKRFAQIVYERGKICNIGHLARRA